MGSSQPAFAVIAVAVAMAATACSSILSLDDYIRVDDPGGGGGAGATGGISDAGAGGGGSVGGGSGGTEVCTCVPDAPAGWEGPYAMTLGADDTVSCAGAYPTNVYDDAVGIGETGALANCTDCACGALTGETCEPVAVTTFANDNACTVATGTVPFNQIGECVFLSLAAGTFALMSSVDAVGGSCLPSGGDPVGEPPPGFQQWGAICDGANEAGQGSCGAGDRCYPEPSDVGNTRFCVVGGGGGLQCPPGYTSAPPLEVVTNFTDGRTCGCTCPVANGTCNAHVTMYFNNNCATPVSAELDNDGMCETIVSNARSGRLSSSSVATAGTCTPDGGPKGLITVDASVTVCCSN